MAVPKTTATRCRDRAYKHCTNNPIPTSFFHAQYCLPVILQHKEICHVQKKRCKDGVICAVFVCPVSTPSCCGFWHCHPYIPVHFWKMFYLLYIISSATFLSTSLTLSSIRSRHALIFSFAVWALLLDSAIALTALTILKYASESGDPAC